VVIFYVIVWALVFGAVGWYIGQRKGQPILGALVCICFGPLGVLISAVSNTDKKALARQAARRGMKLCPHCGKAMHQSVAQCVNCGAPFPDVAPTVTTESPHPPGWWIASDGNWYPPELHPNVPPPPTPK
jgi:hypothetical protein